MRTISGVAPHRATVRRHTAWVDGVDEEPPSQPTTRLRRAFESPLGVAVVCVVSFMVIGSALLPFHFVPFQFALQSLLGFSMAPPTPTDARIGKIVFTPFDGNACRKILFDNKTGAFGPDQHFRCHEPAGEREIVMARANAARSNLIKQAFTFPGAR